MPLFRAPVVSRIAVAMALAAALALSACGRKSGLDAPPSASLADTPSPAVQESSQPTSDIWAADRPVAPKVSKKSFPLDWLIN